MSKLVLTTHPPLTLNCPTRPVWTPDEKDPENVEKNQKIEKLSERDSRIYLHVFFLRLINANCWFWVLTTESLNTDNSDSQLQFSMPRSNESEVSRTRSVFAQMDRNLKSILP